MDWTYIVLVLPAAIFALIAQASVKSSFKKYAKVAASCRLPAQEVVRRVLAENGIFNVRVEPIAGELTDHFDPRDNVIRLSQSVYNNYSIAAIGVACHEAGHAMQHAVNYAPVKVRTAIVPVTNLGSKLAMPLIFGGIILSGFSSMFAYVAYVGVICFALCTVFQLVTLPVEFNASGRALRALSSQNIMTKDELRGTKKVLSAAAMTYVAALAVSLMQLIRFLIILNNRRD